MWRCFVIVVWCSLFLGLSRIVVCCVLFDVCCLRVVFALSFCGLLCVAFDVVGCCG